MKYRQHQGFTMIEVLVAILIVVFGILGTAALDTTAKSGTFDASQRTLATALAADILERMSANPQGVEDGAYNGSYGGGSVAAAGCAGLAASCNAAELAAADLYEWEQQLLGSQVTLGNADIGGLVNVSGCIQNTDGLITVVVVWRGKSSLTDPSTGADAFVKGCGLTGGYRRQVVIQTFIDT